MRLRNWTGGIEYKFIRDAYFVFNGPLIITSVEPETNTRLEMFLDRYLLQNTCIL